MSGEAAISIRELSKSFRLFGRKSQFQTLKSALLKREMLPSADSSIEALREITFDIPRGQSFGVIGRNGSGKSTLLKIVSGILKPTRGLVSVNGRISALIELGAGFHPEISGRENIYINGIMLGLSKREVEKRFDRIVEFAGIGEFLDQPVKTYSSGMYVRLGFAVAVHVDPEILLIDEILSVGDEEFSAKCIAKIQEMKAKGVTLIFVTHQLGLVRELCDRAAWLDKGAVRSIGDPDRVVDDYLQEVAGQKPATDASEEDLRSEDEERDPNEEERWGSQEVILSDVSLCDLEGRQLVALGSQEPVVIEMTVEVKEPQTDFVFGLAFYHADGTCVYGTNTEVEAYRADRLDENGRVRFVIHSLDLVGGTYRLDVAVHTKNGRAFDYRRGVIRFVVGSARHEVGVYRPPHGWEFEGGIHLTASDERRNVPAEIEQSLKQLDEDE